ncbi:MAG TPA: hypothetical protein VGY54_07925 [Polyangiaceae bacterium]|nr:hypothetical protein [Polyangiaceae bacterium]
MPTSLRSRLNELASTFASSVVDAIRGSSVDELLAESSGGSSRGAPRVAARPLAAKGRRRGGRLPRRSEGDIANVIEQIVGLLRQHSGGLRAEQIREKLGLLAKELPRPLKDGLDAGRFRKSGQKRATTYSIKGSTAGKLRAARDGSGRKKVKAKGVRRRGKRSRPAEKPTERSPEKRDLGATNGSAQAS